MQYSVVNSVEMAGKERQDEWSKDCQAFTNAEEACLEKWRESARPSKDQS
jgi:hypothetical protein